MVLKPKTTRRSTETKEQALEDVARESTTRLNAEVPVNLHDRVKMQAIKEHGSITGIVIKALDEYLSKYSDD